MGAAEVWKFAPAYELPSWPFVRAARPRRARAAPLSGRHRRRRARRPGARLRPRAARHRRRRPRRGRHRRRARRVVARHLLRAEEPRVLRPARHLRADPREGHHLVGRPHLLGRRRDLFVQPEGRELLRAAALHQPAAVLPRVVPGRADPRARCRGDPLEEQGRPRRARQRRRGGRGRDAGRRVRARGRVVHRRHRRQQQDPRRARPRGASVAPHRPLVHQRRPLQDAVRGRALDLDRRALQRGPRRLAAPDGRRRLAPRLPDGRARRPGIDQPSRGRRRAPARAARPRRRVRVRLDRPVPVPRPPARHLPRRPDDLHRRCRARRLPVRRARRQQRHPGRRQPRLEARPRPAGTGAAKRWSTATTTSATRRRSRTCA